MPLFFVAQSLIKNPRNSPYDMLMVKSPCFFTKKTKTENGYLLLV